MKLKKFKFKQILKLHLLNSRAYEHAIKKINSGSLTDFNLTQIVGDFKKALHVIFEYHQVNKQILFVGIPKKLEVKINKLTQHAAVDTNFELQAVISNNINAIKSSHSEKPLMVKTYSNLLMPKLLKKPDLIVLVSHKKKQNVIKESCVARIPIIVFNSEENLNLSPSQGSYNLIGFSGNSASETNFFFLGLNFLFKRFKNKAH